MMKKLSFLLFIIIFVMAFPNKGQAASGHSNVYLNGKELEFATNVKMENINNNIMIPIRVVSENLGFEVLWQQKERTVTIKNKQSVIKLVVNQKTAYVDSKKATLSIAPILKNDTVMVPLRFVGEEMGLLVDWNNKTKTVYLLSPDKGPDETDQEESVTDPDDNDKPSSPVLATIKSMNFTENRLMIGITGNTQPKVSILSAPDRIVIDMPYAQFSDTYQISQPLDKNLNGSFYVLGSPAISQVRYSLFNNSPATVRVVMDMNYMPKYSAYTENNMFVIELDASMPDTNYPNVGNGKKIVVIDAGHGAHDPGASGAIGKKEPGKKEKDFNLAVALKTEKLLKNEPELEVVLTRRNDTFLDLKQRVKIANDLNASVFVSIHANSSTSAAATGTETYYKNDSSLAFAKIMHKYLVPATGLKDRGVRYGNFHVIRETKMAAVLLEAGYLSNKSDESKLFTEDLQNRVAQGIVNGIKEYLGVK
ncbi:N-acetylmuramoyl-L-alanine amidase [Paenibacillus sp. CMAA1364]